MVDNTHSSVEEVSAGGVEIKLEARVVRGLLDVDVGVLGEALEEIEGVELVFLPGLFHVVLEVHELALDGLLVLLELRALEVVLDLVGNWHDLFLDVLERDVDGLGVNRLRLDVVVTGSEGLLGLSAEDDESGGATDVLAELLPLLGVVRVDGIFDIVVDIDAIDEEVLADVPGEADGRFEGGDDLAELLDIILEVFAVRDGVLGLFGDVGHVLDAIKLGVEAGGLAVVVGLLNGRDDSFNIVDAGRKLVEAFGGDGTLEEAFNEVDDLASGHLDGFLHDLSARASDESSCNVLVHNNYKMRRKRH